MEIVRMKFGSHLYGTSTPASDVDLKAVHIPTAEQILLGRTARAINQVTKVDVTAKNTAEDTDFESFSLHNFMKLLCEGQTVCLDMLFCPVNMQEKHSLQWEWIYRHRKEFISKQCQSFIGYCRQQANKYGIKGSRVAATRRVLDFLKAGAEKHGHLCKVRELPWFEFEFCEHSEIVNIEIRGQEQHVPHLSICNRKVPFGNTLKEATSVYQRLMDDYGQRALMAESNDGVDWKALSHAVRVGRQAITILEGNDLIFPLPYAEDLLKIKTGQLDYKIVGEEIEDLLLAVEKAAEKSPLPATPNIELAERFIMQVYSNEVHNARLAERFGYFGEVD